MRNLVAAPVIIFAVILQSAIVSRVYLLSGIADLPLVMLAAWALQEEVETVLALGCCHEFAGWVCFRLPWLAPLIGYFAVVGLAQILQGRVWQAPLLAMFSRYFSWLDHFKPFNVCSITSFRCFAACERCSGCAHFAKCIA